MSGDGSETTPETTRRFVNNRDTQIGTGNLAGLSFGQDKWKYPYEATVEHPAEFFRRADGGFGITDATRDSVFGAPDKDPWSEGPIQGMMNFFGLVSGGEGWGAGTGSGSKYNFMPTNQEFRENTPPTVFINSLVQISDNRVLFCQFRNMIHIEILK